MRAVRILLLNGPNLGRLGSRAPEIYGSTTLAQVVEAVRAAAEDRGSTVDALQSNHEGTLIDRLEQRDYDGVIINPGALAHTSYALHDALVAAEKPVIEVHVSDIRAREEWRRVSVIEPACAGQVIGKGWRGYLEAVTLLIESTGAVGSDRA
ncbi:MAG: 3-dehydroquinate dehydratase [Chloroflexota bacterium]|nr:3-dehydroquinate dehydratase [Chloroflexota bacterium]